MGATLNPPERDALKEQLDRLGEERFNLLEHGQLHQLASVESDGGPVISLYLDLSPQYRLKRGWGAALKSLVHESLGRLRAQADDAGPDPKSVESQLLEIERSINENLPALGRGVAVFSCAPLGLWQQIALPLPLPNRLEIGRHPFLRPLLRIQDEHDLYAIVLLDKRRARLFISQHGYLQEVFDLFEDTPPKQKQGGWSAMRFQRHHEAHVLWHAGAVGHATSLIMERFGARHLLVSGTQEVLAEYREHLPYAAAERLDGEFGVRIDASEQEIAKAIEPLHRRVEAREEVTTIESIQEAISARRGVWGLDETLRALTEQRVMTLVVADQFRSTGGECLHCRMISTQNGAACPSCGNELHPVDDVVDLALERALMQEASLELVRSREALELLASAAPIGALLRF